MRDPEAWGLPVEAVASLGDDLRVFHTRFQPCLCTRTHDTSEQAYHYWRGQLTMDDARTYANIAERLTGTDGQALQHFMSQSPWSGGAMLRQVQQEVAAHPSLVTGRVGILDDTADAKAGGASIGASRQRNGRLGKVDQCQATVSLAVAHPASGTWALVGGALYLPREWFTPAFAIRREKAGLPATRTFQSKPTLGLELLREARGHGLALELVACDDAYGRGRAFRATLAADGYQYAAEVPSATKVYLDEPRVGLPRRRHNTGRRPTRLKVVSRQRPHKISQLVRGERLTWERVTIRPTERGALVADFAVQRVWTLTPTLEVRAEWLVVRRDLDGRLTCVLLNAPPDTPHAVLRERSCVRYFTERAYQDAKSELGWGDFQARKYRAWEHHFALTAAASWFIATVKLTWREKYARAPELSQQLELEVLPALSTANVRELLQASLPVPQLSPDQARHLVVKHLLNRARATRSRTRKQRAHNQRT